MTMRDMTDLMLYLLSETIATPIFIGNRVVLVVFLVDLM
jgi:hypothetical protein